MDWFLGFLRLKVCRFGPINLSPVPSLVRGASSRGSQKTLGPFICCGRGTSRHRPIFVPACLATRPRGIYQLEQASEPARKEAKRDVVAASSPEAPVGWPGPLFSRPASAQGEISGGSARAWIEGGCFSLPLLLVLATGSGPIARPYGAFSRVADRPLVLALREVVAPGEVASKGLPMKTVSPSHGRLAYAVSAPSARTRGLRSRNSP